METGAQISGLSASEDEGPLSETSPLPLRRVLQHSTLEEAALSEHRQSLGCVPSPLPACASWDLPSQQPGLSPKAALQEGQPSNIWASGASSGLVGPDRDPWAPEEDMPTPASGAWLWAHKCCPDFKSARRAHRGPLTPWESVGAWP
nr:coiled-coil domain-containing protein 201-like [Manis javanica]